MPKKTKAAQKKIEGIACVEKPEESSQDRSYYYDDAHGYEDYDPENENDDEAGDD